MQFMGLKLCCCFLEVYEGQAQSLLDSTEDFQLNIVVFWPDVSVEICTNFFFALLYPWSGLNTVESQYYKVEINKILKNK